VELLESPGHIQTSSRREILVWITFQLIGDSVIRVEQESGICSAGMGISYSGDYLHEKLPGQN